MPFKCLHCGSTQVTFWVNTPGVFNAQTGTVEPHPTEGESICDNTELVCFRCRRTVESDFPELRDAVEDAFLDFGIEPQTAPVLQSG